MIRFAWLSIHELITPLILEFDAIQKRHITDLEGQKLLNIRSGNPN